MSDADILSYLLQEQQVYIELTFPAPILWKGLVLIDSPGVGEATRLRESAFPAFYPQGSGQHHLGARGQRKQSVDTSVQRLLTGAAS